MTSPTASYHGYRFPPDIISHAVWPYHRFCLSFRYLWRAVDQDGDVIDILVQSRRDRRAAARFFRKLLKGQGRRPLRLITDKLRSYSAALRTAMPSVIHSTGSTTTIERRCRISDTATRATDATVQIRRVRAAVSLGARAHSESLSVDRHLLRAVHHRLLRTRAFGV